MPHNRAKTVKARQATRERRKNADENKTEIAKARQATHKFRQNATKDREKLHETWLIKIKLVILPPQMADYQYHRPYVLTSSAQ